MLLFGYFFTSSFWVLYFGLELQWMLLCNFIIVYSIWRGLMNYVVLNSILSIWFIVGILLSSSLILVYGCFGKVGYFPFILVLSYQYYSSNYIWIIYDQLNKWGYFRVILFLVYFSICLFMNFGYWFILVNFLIIIYYIKFIFSIKHLILISSLQLFLFILCGLYFEDELYSLLLLIIYSITIIYVLWDCQGIERKGEKKKMIKK